jgi:predicted HicB family RNase H-like nuclease
MKNTLSYKGFTSRVEFDADDNIFVGRVLGIRDIIGFHGETVSELTTDFHNAIDHYLNVCRERGETPQKPYSGNLMLRVPQEVHAAVAMAAEAHGKSLNQWAANVLKEAADAR